ncbi:MAG TPA: Ig-like domain-containing protein, partial [Rubrobacter sp.]|nr:Ig-like domain-containing protein [Rubrobacter sp.]
EHGSVENDTSPTFAFDSSEPDSTFKCRIYRSGLTPPAFGACSGTGTHTETISSGTYTFDVQATDPRGNTDPTPAFRTWTVDTKGPTVETWSPKGRKVSPRAKPTVTFSEKMNKALIEARRDGNPTTFVLRKGTRKVAASVSYIEDGNTFKAVLTPNKRLRRGATYTATVTTAAEDLAGNAVVAKTWRFTVK